MKDESFGKYLLLLVVAGVLLGFVGSVLIFKIFFPNIIYKTETVIVHKLDYDQKCLELGGRTRAENNRIYCAKEIEVNLEETESAFSHEHDIIWCPPNCGYNEELLRIKQNASTTYTVPHDFPPQFYWDEDNKMHFMPYVKCGDSYCTKN